MKIKDLLNRVDKELTVNAAISLDIENHKDDKTFDIVRQNNQREGYSKVFDILRATKPFPKKGQNWTILVNEIEEPCEKYKYPHVHGMKKGSDLTWSMMFTPWKEWLNMEFKSDYPDLNQTMGYIIWEMTWTGFSPEKVKAEFDKLKESAKEIKKEFKKKR